MKGKIFSINISKNKGTAKVPANKASVKEDFGIRDDAHAGNNKRQISLLSIEQIKEQNFNPGDFAENITTQGLDLSKLKIGDKIKIKDVVLEVSQIGKECHSHCNIYERLGNCIMPNEGIFTRVLNGGEIEIGDEIIL